MSLLFSPTPCLNFLWLQRLGTMFYQVSSSIYFIFALYLYIYYLLIQFYSASTTDSLLQVCIKLSLEKLEIT